jgi:ribonuclease Y
LTSSIGWVVTAADAISAWRPWARFNTKEVFVERMSELEKLISSVDWVDKVHIMQAGREIMIFVNPTQVDDLWVQVLLKNVAVKVEDQLDYPGIIRVVWIRETKVVDYLR